MFPLWFGCLITFGNRSGGFRSSLHFFPVQELHAHINGSISEATMERLVEKKGPAVDTDWRLMYRKGDTDTLDGYLLRKKNHCRSKTT